MGRCWMPVPTSGIFRRLCVMAEHHRGPALSQCRTCRTGCVACDDYHTVGFY
jgi:hypothetical protein